MIQRSIYQNFQFSLQHFPVTGIIGLRQVGKTTLVKDWQARNDAIYLDLERTSDLNKLSDPELYLSLYKDKTVILDEIQHLPELFPLIRSLVDENRKGGRFVILGSASPNLLRQSSESLAGRINYLEMYPLNLQEVKGHISQENLWLSGGFPEPALSGKSAFISSWYRSFIQSYLQRDLPMYGLPAAPKVSRQLLQMIASAHGSLLNYSNFAKSLGLSVPTVKNYLSFFENAFLSNQLSPWHDNLKKRLVKSPKIYIRDTGMLHYLLGIETLDALMGHVLLGNSWEGFVINQVKSLVRSDDEIFFYRTQDGAEIDLLLRRNNQWKSAAEIKFTNSPKISKGTFLAMNDLGLEKLYVITPNSETYPISKNIIVTSLYDYLKNLSNT